MRIFSFLMMVFTVPAFANTLMALDDDQFIKMFSTGVPSECVQYYQNDAKDLMDMIAGLKIVDRPGGASRNATDAEKQETLSNLLEGLGARCFEEVRRSIIRHEYLDGMPDTLCAEDFLDEQVLARYDALISNK